MWYVVRGKVSGKELEVWSGNAENKRKKLKKIRSKQLGYDEFKSSDKIKLSF